MQLRFKLVLLPFALLLVAQYARPQTAGPIAGPLTVSSNPLFQGRERYGSHPKRIADLEHASGLGHRGVCATPDFAAFIKFLAAHGHNFTLLWTVEMPRFCNLPSTEGSPPEFAVSPLPWLRTGPGKATDGGLKFDLTKFDPSFFERLRVRTQALNSAGIYAGVYLLTGEFLNLFRCANDGYPLTGVNISMVLMMATPPETKGPTLSR